MSSNIYEQKNTAQAFADLAGDPNGEKSVVWHTLMPHLRALSPHERFLDFGCGTGWLTQRARRELGIDATGYDPATAMIEQAKLSGAADHTMFTPNLADVPAAAFDFIALVFVTATLGDREQLVQVFHDMAACARPGAHIAVFTANAPAVLLRHATYQSFAPEGGLQAGKAYSVDLYHSDGRLLASVSDTFWTQKDIATAGAAAGLETVECTVVRDDITAVNAPAEAHPFHLHLLRKTPDALSSLTR